MDMRRTDPEFTERFEHFALDEVVNEEGQQLPAPTRYLAILATLIGCGGVDAYRQLLPEALDNGVTPFWNKRELYSLSPANPPLWKIAWKKGLRHRLPSSERA